MLDLLGNLLCFMCDTKVFSSERGYLIFARYCFNVFVASTLHSYDQKTIFNTLTLISNLPAMKTLYTYRHVKEENPRHCLHEIATLQLGRPIGSRTNRVNV
jgi:hypothetical protein